MYALKNQPISVDTAAFICLKRGCLAVRQLLNYYLMVAYLLAVSYLMVAYLLAVSYLMAAYLLAVSYLMAA